MVRDYSIQKENELCNIINKIDVENENTIVDTILDALNWLKSFLLFFSVADYEDSLKTYNSEIQIQTKVKTQRLKDIFRLERENDSEYASSKFDGCLQELKSLEMGLLQFSNIINPTTTITLTQANVLNTSKKVKSSIEAITKAKQAGIPKSEKGSQKYGSRYFADVGETSIAYIKKTTDFIDHIAMKNNTSVNEAWDLVKRSFQSSSDGIKTVVAGSFGLSMIFNNKFANKPDAHLSDTPVPGWAGSLNRAVGYRVPKKTQRDALSLNYSFAKAGDYPLKASVEKGIFNFYKDKLYGINGDLNQGKKYLISKGSELKTRLGEGAYFSEIQNKLDVYKSETDGNYEAGIAYQQRGYKYSNSQYEITSGINSANLKVFGSNQVERGNLNAGASAHYYLFSESIKIKDPVHDLLTLKFTSNIGAGADAALGWTKGKLSSNLGVTSGVGFNLQSDINFSKIPQALEDDIQHAKAQKIEFSRKTKSNIALFKRDGFSSDFVYKLLTGN